MITRIDKDSIEWPRLLLKLDERKLNGTLN